jgi:hypothetical protein
MEATMGTECDFDKLRQSNSILWNWSKYFKIHNKSFLAFAYKLKEKKQKYLNLISGKKLKEKFISDFDVMFYAAEIENDLFKQYRPTIFSIIRRFSVKNQETKEKLFDVGTLALRGAIWRYNREEVKFVTYAMNGITLAVRGMASLEVKRFKNMKESKYFFTRDDNQNYLMGIKIIADFKSLEPHEELLRNESLNEEIIAKFAELNSDEIKLVQFHVYNNTERYRQKFRDYYNKRHGKNITNFQISSMWRKTKKKIWKHLISSQYSDSLANCPIP